MKTLYVSRYAPNPRKALCLMKAKGLDINDIYDLTVVDMDIMAGEHLSDEFAKINPLKLLPVLVLDDGTVLNDSQAICEYLDRVYGERSIMGNDVVHRAKVCAMRRIAEFEVAYHFMMAFQHSHPSKAQRVDQVPSLAPKSIQRAIDALPYFENILKDHNYLVNDQLSFADIMLYIALDFGKVLKVDPTTQGAGLARFYEQMNEKFSIKACQ